MIPKLIVFDLDGTLYDLNDIIAVYYSMELDFIEHYCGWDEESTRKFFSEHGVMDHKDKDAHSATDLFIEMGIPTQVWTEYREKHFHTDTIKKENAASEECIRRFSELAHIVLLSSNTYLNIGRILDASGIPGCLFEDIVCSDNSPCKGKFSKREAMCELIREYGIDPCEMLSVGDRYNTDIVPALDNGAAGAEVKGSKSLAKLCDDLERSSPENCDEYIYYCR